MPLNWSNVLEVVELDSGIGWSSDDLRAMFHHQLSIRVDSSSDSADAVSTQTLGDVLYDPCPSPQMLAQVERLLAHSLNQAGDETFPQPVSTLLEALYYAARTRANLTLGAKDELNPSTQLQAAIDTPWIDARSAECLRVLHDQISGSQPASGTSRTENADGSRAEKSSSGSRPGNDRTGRRGRYVIERPHAAGGLGVLSVARDVDLNRVVALKEIRPELRQDSDSRQRFVREAQIAGELEHPNIVPVYALGRDESGNPYYAMRFVGGHTLEQAIARHHHEPSRESLRDLLRRFGDVCRAMAYAHSRAIVHRDIKPLNIMLGDFGETWIVDWGIAKRFADIEHNPAPPAEDTPGHLYPFGGKSDSDSNTLAGQSMGTPRYMAPEQQADARQAGPLSDVYGLGAILIQIITGKPPQPGKAINDSPTTAQNGARRALGDVKPLWAVATRAMASDPAARYAGAAEVAAEVERWLADEPVHAHDEPLINTIGRWSRRHRAAVIAGALLLVSTAIVLSISNVRIRGERDEKVVALRERQAALTTADENMRAAQQSERTAQERLVGTLRLTGDSLMAQGRPIEAEERYREAIHLANKARLPEAGVSWGLLESFARSPRALVTAEYPVHPAVPAFPEVDNVLEPDGRTFIAGEADGSIVWREIATGRVQARVKAHGAPVRCLSLSTDGKMLLTGADDGSVTILDAAAKREIRRISAAHDKAVRRVVLSPVGDVFLSASDDGRLKIWDLATGQARANYPSHNGAEHVETPAFAPDGRTVVSGCHDGSIRTWDLATGETLNTVAAAHEKCITELRFDAAGNKVISRATDDKLHTWYYPDIEPHLTLSSSNHGNRSFALAGNQFVVSGGDGSLTTWEVDGTQRAVQISRPSQLSGIDVDASGSMVLATDITGAVNLWPLGASNETTVMRGHGNQILTAAFSGDGLMAVSAGWDGTVRVWDVATGHELRRFGDDPATRYWCAIFGPNDETVLAGDGTGRLVAWSLSSGETIFGVDAHLKKPEDTSTTGPTTQPSGIVTSIALSSDQRTLATAGADKLVKLRDATTGAELRTLAGHEGTVRWIAFTPDGTKLLSASYDTHVKVWDVADGKEVGQLNGHTRWVSCVAVSPDGKFAATGGRDGMMILWDLATGTATRTIGAHTESVCAVAFSRDGLTIASGGEDRALRLWDRLTGDELHQFTDQGAPIKDVRFSPDGVQLMAASLDSTLRIYDVSRPATYEKFGAELSLARQALQANPHDSAALQTIGQWFAFRGSNAIAASLLNEARAGGAPISSVTLARVNWHLGRLPEAEEHFRSAKEKTEGPAKYLDLCITAARADQKTRTNAPTTQASLR